MRTQFCDALVARSSNQEMIFLTGDVGFMALEPLRGALGHRFINAGIAEQNMVSVAAGLARQGLDVWVYSIAPFCYARAYEQIRNDITFHKLPVKIVGNGGGYGYGVMGPTHHAIEDYGVLLCLPHMSVYVPAFDEDVGAVVSRAGACGHPVYIRLGRGERPKHFLPPSYAPWRQLTDGNGPVVIAVGPLVGSYIDAFEGVPMGRRPSLWTVSELPLERNPLPARLLERIAQAADLIVIEEHVRRGSFGAELAGHLLESGVRVGRFRHLCARAHNFARYGSQGFMRRQSALDVESVLAELARD